MNNHPFNPNGGGFGYDFGQSPVPTSEYPSTRQNAGVNVYASHGQDNLIAGRPSFTPEYGGSDIAPQLLLSMPMGQTQHHTMTQSVQMNGLSYGSSSSWPNPSPSGQGQHSQNPGSRPGQSTTSIEIAGPSSTRAILPDLVLVNIKNPNHTEGNTEGNTIIARFSKSQEFAAMDIKMARALYLEVHPIPLAKQVPILTDIGLATPQHYTTFVCDIPDLGFTDLKINVQLLEWNRPLHFGTKFRKRLEREHPMSEGNEATHMQLTSPLLQPPVLGNASPSANGALSMQVAENSTYVRSPTVAQSPLLLRIPDQPIRYPSSPAALTPGGSSAGWAATSVFDINNTGTGPSPSTSFQDLTPGIPGEGHSVAEDYCPDNTEYPLSHASGPYSGDVYESYFSSQWSTI
ncbi:hypothetical protein QBC38DRAFT_4586 [Podospora fimiseda]|uniref:Uncharacterized protein n=1 Tax=Podospora fimiseda TaxID=252190 RepID=A0AAN7BZR3_9PEZI|nr:hypothetical protein QBC38DRAFT_4586 [Podospora fimiseda]